MTRKLSMPSRPSRTSCSILALATVLLVGASPAAAQSFQGTGSITTNTGGAANIGTGSGTTFIEVNPGQTVIDWTPTPDGGAPGTAINFQPAGTTATFNSSGDYAVLNRIGVTDNSRMIALNGTIQSYIGGEFIGGAIYFYSPGGFVLGSNAVINVGSLVLSASPISVDPDTGNFINNGTVQFGQALNADADIVTNAGAQINAAFADDSYVALVAPRVAHNGSINVNGAAALVGAEAATITFRTSGLFDIAVDVGTTDANGVEVGSTGSITGPAAGTGNDHRAYLVAVPKNSALTMLIASGASLGFDVAGAAEVIDNAVVLSAGHNISFGDTSDAPAPASGGDASISIGNSSFTSALYARANGDIAARAVDGSMTFASDASLRARDQVTLEAWGGGTVSVAGDLRLSADADALIDGQSATAGNVTLQALGGGVVNVTGDAVLTAIGTGGFSSEPGVASGDGRGGTVLVQTTTGGDINLGGILEADASGYGGSFNGLVDGGDGFGGTVNVYASGGGTLSVTQAARLRADGEAGSPSDCNSCGGVGGIGDAGAINVQAHSGPGSILDFDDVLYIWANGVGGQGQTGGDGLGGDVTFSAGTGSSVTVASDVSIQADGLGGGANGSGAAGGDGFGGGNGGGNVQTFAEGGTLAIAGNFSTSVDGYGGDSQGGTGGTGTGGLGQLFATGGGTATVGAFAFISASGYGGAGLIGGSGIGGRPLNGGGAYFSSNSGGSLTITGSAELRATGNGGFAFDADGLGGDGGFGQGGHAEAYANAAGLAFGSTLFLDVDGRGGSAGAFGATTGAGQGGDAYLQAVGGGAVTVAGDLYAFAEGEGGNPGFGVFSGNGTGGTVTIASRDNGATATAASALTISGDAFLEADGYAGYSSECGIGCSNGGIGEGGDIFIASTGTLTTGNTLSFGSSLSASANGYGGDSFDDGEGGIVGDAGDGFGGSVSLYANGGNSIGVDGEVALEAIGYGGYDAVGGLAGDGTGGTVEITTDGAAGNVIDLGSSVVLDASGYGGDSGSQSGGDGDGGDGIGGTARVVIAGGALDVLGDLTVHSIGNGGDTFGGIGGDGTGNNARILAVGGDIDIGGSAYVNASGFGGDGATGGTGAGGGDFLTATNGAHIFASNSDIVIGGSAVVESSGQGGDGSDGIGGSGGDGVGGWATIQAGNGDVGPSSITVQGVEASANVIADGIGGSGGDGAFGLDGESAGIGTSGGDGGNGGDGGAGIGGVSSITAAAGNGVLNIAFASASARGQGGFGGAGGNGGIGGNGDGGAGGNGGAGGAGGAGGDATGGQATIGTANGSGLAAGSNLGVGNYGAIFVDASAQGGDGGAGGSGGAAGSGDPAGIAGAGGNGGAGGFANGGTAVLLVSGGTVNAGGVDLVANATGGDGGSGVIAGVGGDAESDEAMVLVTERAGNVAQRGTLNAGAITGTVVSTGGSGSTDGIGLMEGGSGFIVANGDVTIDSLDFAIVADGQIADLATDSIAIVNSTVVVNQGFSFNTAGVASIHADNATLNAVSFEVSADNFVHDPERSFPAVIGTISADSVDLSTNGDLIVDAHLISTSALNLSVPGLIDIEDATSGSDLTLDAGGSISGGSMTAAGLIDASAGGDIMLDNVIAGADITILSTGGTIFANGLSAGGLVDLHGAIDVSVGDITAGSSINILADSGLISTGGLLAQTDVTLSAAGAIVTGDISTFGTVDANGGTLGLGDVSGSVLILTSNVGDISTGDLVAFSSLAVDSAEDFLFGSITAPLVDLAAPGSIIGGFIDSESDITAVAGGDIDVGDLTSGGFDGEVFQFGDISLTAGGDIAAGVISAAGAVSGDAGAGISMLDISAFNAVDLLAGTSIGTGNVDAGSVAMSAGTNITTGDITAFGAVDLDALGFILTGDILAGSIDLFAGGDITTGDLTTEIVDLFQDEEEVVALLFPGASITLESGGDITTENISSYDGVYANAGGGITTGTIDAVDFVQLLAGANIATGDIDAGAYIDIYSSGGGIATGNLTGTQIDLEANGDISFANVDADALDFEATGAVTGGDIVAISQVGGEAQGAVTLGDITVGPGAPQVDDFSVGIASPTSITVGDVSGTDRIGFATFGDLTTGNLSASDLVMALVGGDIVTGSITTDADGTVYMGDASMYIGAGGGEDAFDASLVLALDPVATGGSITIGGPVLTGLFQAAAGDGLTTGAIDARTIEASAGGTATLNGMWSAETVTLASNDIDITATGGISGGGLVTLVSTNATQALIGDGLTGTGYALSNAEFGRIEGGSVYILARGDASAAIDMLVGDLTVTGPTAGSTIEDSDGILVFATGDIATQTPGGVIRVVGDVGATGFGAGNAMEFHADRFELDAATGSISIVSSGTTLGGELGLYASQIHVASGEILDQLAVDPQYDGYQDDLNAPAAAQRPEGVLNAGVIWIESDNLQSILIQNTGTAETPAGFLANEIFVNEDFEVAGPPGSIDVVVNGQLITETGTLTGVAVRDALVAGEDLTPFTANSTINGCLLAGPCGVVEPPEPPFPPGFTPTPGIQNEVVLIKHNLLPPPEFGNEDFIDDNDEITDEGATSPIKPPHPLFDTSALGDKGDVNDPVSGSGNPALMETPSGSPPAQEKQP